jgi:hypothetical protein
MRGDCKMKITKEDYQRLNSMIVTVLHENQGVQVIYKNKGLSDMRFRWDIYHKITDDAQHSGRVGDYLFCRRLYDYLNDDNLDTALRAIVSSYNQDCISGSPHP